MSRASAKMAIVLEQVRGRWVHHRALSSALAWRVLGILISFVLTFLLGRYLGAAANGTYALVVQTTTFLATLGLIGLDFSVVRHFSKSLAERRPVSVLVYLKLLGICIALLGAISLVIIFGGKLVWDVLFGHAVERSLLTLVCAMFLIRGVLQILSGFLRSQNRTAIGIALTLVVMPVAAVAVLLTGLAVNVEQALWATTAGGAAAVVWGFLASARHVSRSSDALHIPMRPIVASSLPLWGQL